LHCHASSEVDLPGFRRCLIALVLALGPCSDAVAQAPGALSGLVVDSSGAAVPAAAVLLEHAEFPARQTVSGPDGRFGFRDVPPGDYVLRVIAAGFAEERTTVKVSAVAEPGMTVALRPAPFSDTVTVTGSRGAARLETPASASVLTSAELLNSAPVTVDEALRNTPGFSLFRRSSSRTSTPPTQGVTLRGIAGSGASRTLVLADGLPLNDPFGSWVYWNRIPIVAIERVEVVRGAAGDLYGSDALGGVVQILTFVPGRSRVRAVLEGASFETIRASVFGSGQAGSWFGSGAAEWEDTAGVVRIPENERGPVDTPMTSDYRTGFATFGYSGTGWRAQVRAAATTEDRSRGTPLLVDDTSWRQFSGEISGTVGGGAWLIRAAGGSQEYFNNFSSVSSDRATERLTREQSIPTSSANVAAQFARSWSRHAVLLGAEGKRTRSTIEEIRYSPAAVRTGPFLFGGTESSGSAFGRVSLAAAASVTVMLSVRGDVWQSTPLESALPSKSISFFSPSASVSWRASDAITLRTAAYQSYRTPTLNELHRGFRVGDTVTDGNPLLDSERLVGVEGGALFARGRLSARVTGFWSTIDNLVANITLSTTPQLITRQKQNADTARAAGLEAESDLRLSPRLTINVLTAVTASHFVDTPKQPEIQGKRVPQVPLYQIGGGVTYTAPGTFTASAQMRALGAQFEDDRNELELGAYSVVDGYVSRTLRRGTQIFLAMENILNAEYDVGRTPLRTIGWPRAIRGGVRLFLP
jgi:outer membrane receptor protein involved in Fe transport